MQRQAEQIFMSGVLQCFNNVNEETWNPGSAYSNDLNSSILTLIY